MKNYAKKSLKSSNGITLIALVITIIVLLILAGISISMLSGDNGLLTKTTEAKEETRAGTVQEERDLWKMSQEANNYTGTEPIESLNVLLERLGPNNQKLLTADEIEDIKVTGQVTIGKRTIVFGIPIQEDDLEIGDVVTADGLATFKDSEDNDIKWIYFGKDDSGKRLITTQKAISSVFTVEPTAQKWLSYENDIKNLCANLYANNGGTIGTARSITLEDINAVTGFTEPEFYQYTFIGGDENKYSENK